ncbi:hypothetical protein [Haladaptatus sp. NG-WS-4]
MTNSSPALTTLVVVVVAASLLSVVGGHTVPFAGGVHVNQDTTNPCPTVGTTDGGFGGMQTTVGTD